MYRKEIVYDRETRDYAMYLDGELAGFARTYHEGEVTLDQLVLNLLSGQCWADATAKDAPPLVDDGVQECIINCPGCDECAPAVVHPRVAAPAPEFLYADLDNQPAGHCFPDESLGDCALCGKAAWLLDETLTAPLCPDHKAQERSWIGNREAMTAAGSVWAPGGPPPPPPPTTPAPTPAPAPSSSLLPLIKLLLDTWAEEPRPTPYDRELAALARAIEPPPPFTLCTVCGDARHQATQCPEVAAERARQERQTRLGLSIHAAYHDHRSALIGLLRDEPEQRQELAEAFALFLSDRTGVTLPVAMVVSRFDQLAA